MQTVNALGGILLDELAPAELSAAALERTLAAIDAVDKEGTGPELDEKQARAKPWLPTSWPRAMAHCEVGRWHWMGPGMYWNRVALPGAADANVFMLRIGAGRMLPRHTHTQSELTQVLYGAFDDGRSTFAAGDFDETDSGVRHQPVTGAEGECICLASVEGKVLFEGWLARTMGALIGM